jgi:hypothetical protein
MSVLGERVRTLTIRIGVQTFGIAIALFESNFLDRLARMRQMGRALLAAVRQRTDSAVHSMAPQRQEAQHETTVKPRVRSARSDGSVPIVFIHQQNSEHLKYSLAQAKASNPRSTVFLLGDDSNSQHPCAEHHQFSDYFAGAAGFERVYKHYSTHGRDFERLCFQRWFILRDFLAAHHIDKCVYLDSDVLLYGNVTEDMAKFRLFDFTVCWNTIGCTLFLNRLDGLESLCQFIMDIYTKKDEYHYDKMVAQFAVRQKHHLRGGATDMTAFELYGELNFGRVGEASYIIDGSTYDPNINMPHPGFEMANNIKKVMWQDHQPYGIYVPTGEKVRFNSLHFNGKAKSLMPQYCTAPVDRPVP